jgi:hypothetical protein
VIHPVSRAARLAAGTFVLAWSVLSGDMHEQLAQLKQSPGKDILVPGSPTLVRWLLRPVLAATVGRSASLRFRFAAWKPPGGFAGEFRDLALIS